MGRILGIDYGERRIGLAVSDPTETIAQALPALQRRRGRRPPFSDLEKIVKEREIERIVVGLPIETSGTEGPQARVTREFGEALRKRIDVPLEYWDERLTSARARREIRRLDLPLSRRREKGRVDAMAAALMLQTYLDAQENR